MDSHLVALDPHQMANAQNDLITWCDTKLGELVIELRQAHHVQESLKKASMSDAQARRLITGIHKRETFYSKIKEALKNGYYILPPIPHQTFAIRTKREAPLENRTFVNVWRDDQIAKAQILPIGEGEYQNSVTEREVVNVQEVQEGNEVVEKNVYANTAWKDIEFPFFPVKPEIIEATTKALQLKIFDWLGVAPQYRSADPMVIGCIKHYKQYQGPIHFFVAWWLDTNTL